MILIDSREQNQDYIQDKLQRSGVESLITCLHSGVDYIIAGTVDSVSVQRKTFGEVCTQMKEIREEIVPNLMTMTENPVLLVEEQFQIDEQGMMWRKQNRMLVPANISARQYYNFLQSIRQMGCEVVTTRDLDHSIWWMYAIHSYVHEQHYPKPKKRYGTDMQALGMMCCISGIGITRANKILKEHSIQELVQMTDVQLSKLLTVNQVVTFRKVMQSVSP